MFIQELNGEITTFMELKRADGSIHYFAVQDNTHVEIDQEAYEAGAKVTN